MGIISLPAHHAPVVIFLHCLPRTAVVGREYTYKGSSILSSLLSPFVCSVTKVISLLLLHSLPLLRSALGFHQRGAKQKEKREREKACVFHLFSREKATLLLSPSPSSSFAFLLLSRRGRKEEEEEAEIAPEMDADEEQGWDSTNEDRGNKKRKSYFF